MKKILGLLVIVLGLTGCSMNVAPTQMFEEKSQNKIEWIATDDESRGLDGSILSLDNVTFEIYKVPIRDRKYIHEEADYLDTKYLYRGESFSVPSSKEYNYEFATKVRCIEFNYSFIFCGPRDEINFFDYEGDIVMEIVRYHGGPIKHIEEDGWTLKGRVVYYRGEQEGYTNQYVFMNENSEAMSKFFEEHKDGGRIVWNN